MRITPRKEEYKPIVDLLESDQYETADALAKAIVKEVCELLWMRDWYAVSHRESTIFNADYGPFASDAEARAFLGRGVAGLGGVARIAKLHSPGMAIAKLEGKKFKGFCANCGHTKQEHLMDGKSRGKCSLSKCNCPVWKEIK